MAALSEALADFSLLLKGNLQLVPSLFRLLTSFPRMHCWKRFGAPSPCLGLPRWLSGKEYACGVRDAGSIPRLGKSLEEEMATHSSILAWKIPWAEEPGRLQSTGLQRVRHNWATEHTILPKLYPKTEKERILPHSCYKASITLIQKPDKEFTRK